jgi:hypothetical protein
LIKKVRAANKLETAYSQRKKIDTIQIRDEQPPRMVVLVLQNWADKSGATRKGRNKKAKPAIKADFKVVIFMS